MAESARPAPGHPEHSLHARHTPRAEPVLRNNDERDSASENGQTQESIPAYSLSLPNALQLRGRSNQPVTIALMRQMQQTYGNRASRRLLQRAIQPSISQTVESDAAHANDNVADNGGQAADSIVVQRKIGFEFETGNLVYGAEPKEHIHQSDKGFHIDADTVLKGGNAIEFVIEPQDSFPESLSAVKAAVKMTADITEQAKKQKKKKKQDGVSVRLGKDEKQVEVNDEGWAATAQHTEGVRMEHLGAFLDKNLDKSTEEKLYRQQFASRFNKPRKSTTTTDNASASNASSGGDTAEEGMAKLVSWYIVALQSWNPNTDSTEGPKNALATMSRTDFYSMYKWIKENGNEKAYEKAEKEALEKLGVQANERLIQKPYPQADEGSKMTLNNLTVGKWLKSMREGSLMPVVKDKTAKDWEFEEEPVKAGKDELSSPEGFRYLQPEYSMGAMGMDNNLVVIESRSAINKEAVPASGWPDFAEEVFDDIKERYGGKAADGYVFDNEDEQEEEEQEEQEN